MSGSHPNTPGLIDARLRAAAISHVQALSLRQGGALSWATIDAGFTYQGERVHLATRARGIFAPRGDRLLGALSVKTVKPRGQRRRWYDDRPDFEANGFEYRYQGDDPLSFDNQLVRGCFTHRLPLIYFLGVAPAVYEPVIALVDGDDPVRRTFWLVPVIQADLALAPVLAQAALIQPPTERRYAMDKVRRRLHQRHFSESVLEAYRTRCAVCHLKHRALLDAAHIIPDADGGEPIVQNGMALCKLHHAAFDAQMLGIDPDYRVHLSPSLLEESDGPMLRDGLQAMHHAKLVLPKRREDWPRRDWLAQRFGALPWR